MERAEAIRRAKERVKQSPEEGALVVFIDPESGDWTFARKEWADRVKMEYDDVVEVE